LDFWDLDFFVVFGLLFFFDFGLGEDDGLVFLDRLRAAAKDE
jgi:hypothetical protein